MKKIFLLLAVCLLTTSGFAKTISFANLDLTLESSDTHVKTYKFLAHDNGLSDSIGSLSLEIQNTDSSDFSLLFWPLLNERDDQGTYQQNDSKLKYVSQDPGKEEAYIEDIRCISDLDGKPEKAIYSLYRAKRMGSMTLLYSFTYIQNLQISDIQYEYTDENKNLITKKVSPATFFNDIVEEHRTQWVEAILELNDEDFE